MCYNRYNGEISSRLLFYYCLYRFARFDRFFITLGMDL